MSPDEIQKKDNKTTTEERKKKIKIKLKIKIKNENNIKEYCFLKNALMIPC